MAWNRIIIPTATVITTILPMRRVHLLGDMEAVTNDPSVLPGSMLFDMIVEGQITANAASTYTAIDEDTRESVTVESGKVVLVPPGTRITVYPAAVAPLPGPPSPPPAAGWSTGQKVAVGAAVVGGIALIVWALS